MKRQILDYSDYYKSELENLELSILDSEQLYSLIFDCFCDDEEIKIVWNNFVNTYYSNAREYNIPLHIDFDNKCLDSVWYGKGKEPVVEIKITEDIYILVSYDLYFSIDYNYYDPKYDECNCIHRYTASTIHPVSIKIINHI